MNAATYTDRAAAIQRSTAANALHTGQARHALGQLTAAELDTLTRWALKVHARLEQEKSHVPATPAR